MVTKKVYTSEDYDALWGRIESEIEYIGNEDSEELNIKAVRQMINYNTGISVAWGEMYDRFLKSDRRKAYLNALAEAEQLPEEFRNQFNEDIKEGIDPKEALENAQQANQDDLDEKKRDNEEQKRKQDAINERRVKIRKLEAEIEEIEYEEPDYDYEGDTSDFDDKNRWNVNRASYEGNYDY
jgi:hypothetical protein